MSIINPQLDWAKLIEQEKAVIQALEMQQAKQLYEQMQKIKKVSQDILSGGKVNFDDATIDRIDEEVDNLSKKIEYLRQVKEKLESCPFKKGDIALHKDYGNCIIQSISVENLNKGSGAYENPNLCVIYSIAYAPPVADLMGRASPGITQAGEEDLLPYTEMSKTLYTKDK